MTSPTKYPVGTTVIPVIRYNNVERQRLYQVLNIGYTNVDTETLKRVAERNAHPAPTNRGCIQARPFSILK